MTSPHWNNKKVIILGAGLEGLSTVNFLQSHYPEYQITVADKADITNLPDKVLSLTGNNYPTSLAAWDLAIVSPGIPPHDPLLATCTPDKLTTATNIFFEECQGKIIGVTGTKGKSTTSSLISHILQSANLPAYLIGNIGNPGLSELNLHNLATDIFVFELSSYQAMRLEQGPDICVITNLFPEHLNYHGSLTQYYQAKMTVAQKQVAGDTLIYNVENEALSNQVSNLTSDSTKIAYPETSGAYVKDQSIYFADEAVIDISDLPLLGNHNITNTLAAITAVKQLTVATDIINSALQSFQPLEHRLQAVGTFKGVSFINDSISTIPESAMAALEAIPTIDTMILGGLDRGYDFSKLAHALQIKNVGTVILFPDSGEKLKEIFKTINYHPRILETSEISAAVAFAFAHTPIGRTCALSPASPSYNLFKNFEDRGHQFIQEVNRQGAE